MATIWFSGPCDTLLQRIQTWEAMYEKGEVRATRTFLTKKLEKQELPVQFLHHVPISKLEIQHLLRILKAEAPKSDKISLFEQILTVANNPALWKANRQRIRADANGNFIISLVCEKYEVTELKNILLAVKEGRSASANPIADLAASKQKAGKGMWES